MIINNHTKNNLNVYTPIKNKKDLKIYEESDHYVYLVYHKVCRALIGKASVLNRFDEWEIICHNCKRITPIHEIKFVRIEKKRER